MDTLDGRYSRMSGKGTQFGAFLDSTLDRLEEGIVLTAVGAYFASRHDQLAVAAVVAAVLFSLMVSYTRARAEALGVAVQGRAGDATGARGDPRDRPACSRAAPRSATSSCWRPPCTCSPRSAW